MRKLPSAQRQNTLTLFLLSSPPPLTHFVSNWPTILFVLFVVAPLLWKEQWSFLVVLKLLHNKQTCPFNLNWLFNSFSSNNIHSNFKKFKPKYYSLNYSHSGSKPQMHCLHSLVKGIAIGHKKDTHFNHETLFFVQNWVFYGVGKLGNIKLFV